MHFNVNFAKCVIFLIFVLKSQHGEIQCHVTPTEFWKKLLGLRPAKTNAARGKVLGSGKILKNSKKFHWGNYSFPPILY